MKAHALRIGKAISAALFVLLLVVVGMKNALAQNQMATLQHNDTITQVFYGPDAFISAHNAAVDGDIITLSSGTFRGCEIAKSIFIHGAGCVFDTLTNISPTIITDNFRISATINCEGIWFSGELLINNDNICFKKCNINTLKSLWNFERNGMQIVNCIINWCNSNSFIGTTIINSIVRYSGYNHTSIYNHNNIYNSVIVFNNGLSIKNIVANNSIIATVSEHEVSNCTFNNCIGIKTGETSLFDGQIANNVMTVDDYSDVFETFTGTVFYENSYQLKEEIATGFLGQDGTEVGIYGGMMPYNPRPSYMRMKRCNVASRSTIDNKLSVEIEVLTDED